MGPFCAGSAREGIILDAQSNPVMTFTSQMSYGNPTAYAKTEVFSQRENSNVVCKIQSGLTERVGSHSTANFAAHLPIPIKICLIMRAAEAAMESYRLEKQARRKSHH
ncbi:unnamed protein product [Oikopleura dioica]|uniref:Uncharacterized protein n=1 Tax=Oikopleura dioica TaxID=34765 RepID=E4XKA9_OIKDI|nr:unnamed protein product [Oikopleura dioica]CBY42055.1 unnamed protein product [Oikopleura dioica]